MFWLLWAKLNGFIQVTLVSTVSKKKEEKLSLALPGVEPGSPGGKPVVLTARLQRISVPEQRYAQLL